MVLLGRCIRLCGTIGRRTGRGTLRDEGHLVFRLRRLGCRLVWYTLHSKGQYIVSTTLHMQYGTLWHYTSPLNLAAGRYQ